MMLATHAMVGAAAASLFSQHPYLAFVAGFASHLVIDAVPHWSSGAYLRSLHRHEDGRYDMRIGRAFVLDLLQLGAESLAGVLLALLVLFVWAGVPLPIVLIGVAAGLLPDALHFVYFKTRSVLLRDFEHLHAIIQREQTNKRYLVLEAALALGAVLVAFVR